MRCCHWGRPFYLLLFLLGDLCRADWHVTALVPFYSLFYPLWLSCLFVTRALLDLCVVAAGSVRFLFHPCQPSVLRVGLIAVLRRWYPLGLFYFLCLSCIFMTSCSVCWHHFAVTFSLFVVIVLEICAERLVAKTPLLFGIFLLFRCFRLDILWRADWCIDAAVTVSFSFIFL